jgi:outer membrane protein
LRKHIGPGLLAIFSLGSLGPAQAADLTLPVLTPAAPPPAQKPFFLRLGANGAFFDTCVAANIAGARVAGSGGIIGNAVSATVEAGVFIMPHIAVSLSAGYPPVLSLKGTGVFAPQGVLVKAQSGLTTLTAHYHLDNFGPIRPYAGLGVGYAVVFRDIAMPATIEPILGNNAAFVLQAGVDYAITDSIGLFIDYKKAWLTQNLNGLTVVPGVAGFLPVSARIRSDPNLLTGGVSYNF